MNSVLGYVACFALISQAGAVSRGSEVPVDAPGSVCLLSITDPTPGEKTLHNYSGGNPDPDYSVQFGEGALISVPHSPNGIGPGVLVTGLPVGRTYLTKVYLKGKRIESFRFRLQATEQNQCLFMKELYLTWDLGPSSRLPRCKCKDAKSTAWK